MARFSSLSIELNQEIDRRGVSRLVVAKIVFVKWPTFYYTGELLDWFNLNMDSRGLRSGKFSDLEDDGSGGRLPSNHQSP